jgi:DNA-binding transcriptional MerR regulator
MAVRAGDIFPVAKVHGHLSAGDAGELVGVTGNTIGQWARWGYIRASQSSGDPHVYSVEDVAEAAVVRALLERKVQHRIVRLAIAHLGDYGPWPLSQAPLATTRDGHLVLLKENGDVFALSARGWQLMTEPPDLEEVHGRLRRAG